MSESSERPGRVVLVTGGTGALGRAVVRRFLEAGDRVHCASRSEEDARGLVTLLGDRAGDVVMHAADVADEASVHGLFGKVERRDGPVEVLANIVGGFAYAPIGETDIEVWDRMIAINATSAFLCCRAAAPSMRDCGWGRMVNVASPPALRPGAANMSAYAASKAAVLNLTYSLAQELASVSITVNAIVPSIIDTDANRQAMADADTSGWLQPDEVAEIVEFLASERAGIVTGTAVNLSRG